MKTKIILSLLMASLFGYCHLSAQHQSLSYYYKGNPIPLNVNSQHFLVYADANRISNERFAKEYQVTEWIEDGKNGVMEAQVSIPNGNYDSVLLDLKAKDYIIDVEPVIGDSVLINTSRLFYVKLHNIQDYPLLCSMVTRIGGEIRGEVSFCENWYELGVNKYSAGNSIETANIFWESQYFEIVDPGFILHFEPTSATSCVSDPRFNEQWGMQAIKACSAWKITKGDTNVRIAVIDMGIDTSLREFDSTHVVFSYDMDTRSSPAHVYSREGSRNETPQDPNPTISIFHGIHVGGIIFANHNRDSVAGVSPNTSMIDISISFEGKDSLASRLSSAINLAVNYGSLVINNSWSENPGEDSLILRTELMEDALDNAINSHRIVVFSAGNCGFDSVNYPASYRDEILSVGAMSMDFKRWSGSNHGKGLDIVAPGDSILSTHYSNGYIKFKGTSMAAPHVSGVAGLMFSINSELTEQDVQDIIEQTAQKVHSDIYHYSDTITRPNGTWNQYMGYGLLDAHRAVLKAAYHKVYGDTALMLCDTNRHAYTVRAPHNANIDSVSFFWTCSDNLQMIAGQNTDSVLVKRTHSGIGQLQCHIVHDGDTVVSTLDIPVASNRPVYDNVSLSGGFSFPDTFVLSREIVIDSLAGLTWQNKTVLCTPDCRIIVRPGGFMTLDHTMLTSACPNEMWQGIEVLGNSAMPQILHNNGILYIENGSVIENAYTAVRNCLATDNAYTTTGGTIQAFSSTFRNNCRSVKFDSYGYTSQPGLMPDYKSKFRQCTFVVNDQNLFAANDTVFTEHVKLWEVRGVQFKGCSFHDSTSTPVSGRRGIYAEDAGLTIDTYCDFAYSGCECPESQSTYSLFSGFTTAVEVNTTGFQYPVLVNQVRFCNNGTGVKVNANNYATVTRCTFNLDQWPVFSGGSIGLLLDHCSGYKVEADTFKRTTYPSGGLPIDNSVGILVVSSGNTYNSLYKNDFFNLTKAISVSGGNRNLQIACDSFYHNKYDIYISTLGAIASSQGSLTQGADNNFDGTQISSIYNLGGMSLTYYHSPGAHHSPYSPLNVTVKSKAIPCNCASTLCGNNNGGMTKSLADFQSDMDVDSYYDAVRTIMSDSLLDLYVLEQWHTAAQPIADPYSLTETRFCEGYSEMFAAAADDADLSNYAEFHALKLALRNNDAAAGANNYSPLQPDGHVNWYTLTPAQIAQLQVIAERNTGRASVMAKGVLCFFFGICYEDEVDATDETDPSAGPRTKRTANDMTGDAALTVYPNPTDDLLYIELSGAGIASVALYDLQGRTIYSQNPSNSPTEHSPTATMSMRNVPAGVYVLCVTDANGKEYRQKIVKK